MKNRYRKCLLPGILAVMLLAGCAGADIGETGEDAARDQTEHTTDSKSDDSAEGIAFEGQDMEGNPVSSDIFSESKLTMVNVWATYCSPCLNEMPALGELAQEYDPGDFQIIGIVSNVQEGGDEDKIRLVEVLIGQTSADYPHLLVNQSLYDSLLADVTAVPTTFFFDQDGKLLDSVLGSREKSEWEEMIQGFLGE